MGRTALGAERPVGNSVPGPVGDGNEVGQRRMVEVGTRGVEDDTQGSSLRGCVGGAVL